MAGPLFYPRILTTSTTTGTGTYTLGSAVSGYQAFSVVGDGNTAYYAAYEVDANGNASGGWEEGLGTYTSSGTTLARTAIFNSSNSGSAVSWAAGTRRISLVDPALTKYQFSTEISITGATTATIDRMHYCTGTSADYTLTLPSVTGMYGRRIWIRNGPLASLSKLVTVDAGSGVNIGPGTSQTRVMWAGETCELWCDGSNWFKRSGITIPMTCTLRRTSNQTVTTGTLTAVGLDAADSDNTGLMADTGSNRMTIRRAGNYLTAGVVAFSTIVTANAVRMIAYCERNEDGVVLKQDEISGFVGGYPHPNFTNLITFAAGDTVKLKGYQDSGVSQQFYGTTTGDACFLTLLEVPTW